MYTAKAVKCTIPNAVPKPSASEALESQGHRPPVTDETEEWATRPAEACNAHMGLCMERLSYTLEHQSPDLEPAPSLRNTS